jgi:hypothetical protein
LHRTSDVELSNIADYQMVCILTYILKRYFLILLLCFGCKIGTAGLVSSAYSSVFSGAFIDGVRDKVRR